MRAIFVESQKILNRWNKVMGKICCEHLTVNTRYNCELPEIGVKTTFTYADLVNEAKYWLSCYYETGNVRCDDRFYGEDNYKIWVEDTGYLKRLIARLEKEDQKKVALIFYEEEE